MRLIDALADHIGETYNTLAQGRPGQQARAWAQETQAKHDPMSVAMGFAPIGMTSGPYKKLFLPLKGFDTRQLDDIMHNMQLDNNLAAQYGHLWDMGGFMPVSRMPLEKFLQEGPIENFFNIYGRGITKAPGPRGKIQSVSYMGLEDAANDWLNFKNMQHPHFGSSETMRSKFNAVGPWDPNRMYLNDGKFNLSSDPYLVYNAAFRPENLNYLKEVNGRIPPENTVYMPWYQDEIQNYVEQNRLLPKGPASHAKIAHQQRVYDKAFSIPPKELIKELEQYNRALDVYGLPQGSQMYLTRAEFPFAPKKEHPEHYNSYSTPTTFIEEVNSAIHTLNKYPNDLDRPEMYVQNLKNNRQLLGQNRAAFGDLNAMHPLRESSRVQPPERLDETIILTKPGVNPLVTPHSVLVKQKDIEHKMPLWEYVQYFLKHGVTPFALGGMMVNNSKENTR